VFAIVEVQAILLCILPIIQGILAYKYWVKTGKNSDGFILLNGFGLLLFLVAPLFLISQPLIVIELTLMYALALIVSYVVCEIIFSWITAKLLESLRQSKSGLKNHKFLCFLWILNLFLFFGVSFVTTLIPYQSRGYLRDIIIILTFLLAAAVNSILIGLRTLNYPENLATSWGRMMVTGSFLCVLYYVASDPFLNKGGSGVAMYVPLNPSTPVLVSILCGLAFFIFQWVVVAGIKVVRKARLPRP